MIGRFGLSLLLTAYLMFCACGGAHRASAQAPPTTWTTGFWFWQGSSLQVESASQTLDVAFVETDRIDGRRPIVRSRNAAEFVGGSLPENVPPAKEYWLVFRFERQQVPDLKTAPFLVEEMVRLREQAHAKGWKVAGLQLDIDSPTRSLKEYAAFLREMRKALPPDLQISITALLDWFRGGTAIADVIEQVDEFVPQFYDVGNMGNEGATIAAKIDAAKWAPQFNRFEKRYRIGISSFGRARLRHASDAQRYPTTFFSDLTPLDLSSSGLAPETAHNEANELVLTYRIKDVTGLGYDQERPNMSYSQLMPGEVIQFILPDPDAIRTAVESARQMKGYVAGVLFFRWPAGNEIMAMAPDDVLAAAGAPSVHETSVSFRMVDGGCVSVHCVDLYLMNAKRYEPAPLRYEIQSSRPLAYFLPQDKIAVRMSEVSKLELTIPPYGGKPQILLGRAVSDSPADFALISPPMEVNR